MTHLPWSGASAEVSKSGEYRYRLDRWVAPSRRPPAIAFVMLNPSTADAFADDPTVRRVRGFAEGFGYRWLIVGNLYAYRATEPRDLVRAHAEGVDVRGPRNDDALLEIAADAETVVLAWGGGVQPLASAAVSAVELLRARGHGGKLRVLGWTARGEPRHPLFIPSVAQLVAP